MTMNLRFGREMILGTCWNPVERGALKMGGLPFGQGQVLIFPVGFVWNFGQKVSHPLEEPSRPTPATLVPGTT